MFPYDVPIPAPLSSREKSQVKSFLLFREQIHGGPFYTATRTWDPATSHTRAYGQEQINQRYGIKNKANVDPFTAVEMPSSRMKRPERALPDLSERPFNKALFPPELHGTLDGEDGGAVGARRAAVKKKTMTLSKVTTLRTAEEIFNMPEVNGVDANDNAKALEALEKLEEGGGEGEDDMDLGLDEDAYEEDMDDAYEDDDGGDYDAEAYFDNGDDDDMDDGGGGDEGEY
ncbi:DNA-directed RNA polymerase III subunit C31 [Cytospora paraplurivora]|uniref:DNA-directed RNA polymerase III subunit n=1 Tax=Cytospora paraplurivora TaxID=2898453 RepID=A0AAN9U2I5_9PEZI